MEGRRIVRYTGSGPAPFQREILESGACGLFLPVMMTEEAAGMLGSWRSEELYCLAEEERLTAADAVGIAADLVEGVLQAVDLYFLPGDYEIRPDLVFVRKWEGRIEFEGLIWETAERGKEDDAAADGKVKEDIASLLSWAEERCPEAEREFLALGRKICSRPGSSLRIVLHRLRGLCDEADMVFGQRRRETGVLLSSASVKSISRNSGSAERTVTETLSARENIRPVRRPTRR